MRSGEPRRRRRAMRHRATVASVLGLVLVVGPAGSGAAAGQAPTRLGESAAMRRLEVVAIATGAASGIHLAAMSGWQWPVAGSGGVPPAIARGFAPPATRYGAGHRGVDVVAPAGAPVLASGAGVVAFAGFVAGRGVVSVDHGPLRTTYEPVEPVVRIGQAVAAGEVIGTLATGHPGCPVGVECLHWGLRRGADYLDPLSLLRRPRSRLLPVWGIPQPARDAADNLSPAAAAAP